MCKMKSTERSAFFRFVIDAYEKYVIILVLPVMLFFDIRTYYTHEYSF